MADILTTQERSVRMSLIRGTGNETTELAAAALLAAMGAKGWRRHWQVKWSPDSLSPRLRGVGVRWNFRPSVVPDFVFPRRKIALFVDGCFWHACPQHGHTPRSNMKFWNAKLERNIARDKYVDAALIQRGWTVLRVWEHELTEKRLATWLARRLALTRDP